MGLSEIRALAEGSAAQRQDCLAELEAEVAVYTDGTQPIHVIWRIVMRMQSMLNWLPL